MGGGILILPPRGRNTRGTGPGFFLLATAHGAVVHPPIVSDPGGFRMPSGLVRSVACMVGVLACLPAPRSARAAFTNFESGHVRPLAIAPAGDQLFGVNTPDNRLAVYTITGGGITLAAEVPVGLEPVAVAARVNLAGRAEAWVVNHLSDSVSVVEINPTDATLSRVVATLLVGDEPRDIVFAGSNHDRAFITCTRRGQNRFPSDPANGPQLTTEGIGRADVWVFNANSLGAALGGTPIGIVQLFGDTPRALAASPDQDAFLVNADATPPALVSTPNAVTGVGTVLFNMAVRPTNGKVYVSNTDAQNQVRFEPFVRGHLAESRVTVISGTTATPHHLNPHINYGVVPGPQTEIDRSLAFPTDLTFSADGSTVFVTGFGSGKVGA